MESIRCVWPRCVRASVLTVQGRTLCTEHYKEVVSMESKGLGAQAYRKIGLVSHRPAMGMVIGLGVAVVLALGCQGCVSTGKGGTVSDQSQAMQANLEALKKAKAKGRFRFEGSGSPLGVGLHAVNFASFGPREASFFFEGEVDFSDAATAVTPTEAVGQ